jgi:hypothetical protein
MTIIDQYIAVQHNYTVWRSGDRVSWYILIIKPTRCTNSQIYIRNRTLHVSDSLYVHHQESSTVHTAIGICHTGYADCLLAEHEFYSKNKFENLVHIVGFITRIWIYSIQQISNMFQLVIKPSWRCVRKSQRQN